jgi:hypothetical protein
MSKDNDSFTINNQQKEANSLRTEEQGRNTNDDFQDGEDEAKIRNRNENLLFKIPTVVIKDQIDTERDYDHNLPSPVAAVNDSNLMTFENSVSESQQNNQNNLFLKPNMGRR